MYRPDYLSGFDINLRRCTLLESASLIIILRRKIQLASREAKSRFRDVCNETIRPSTKSFLWSFNGLKEKFRH
jgi:hypothetical protein